MYKKTITVRGLTLGEGETKICIPITAGTMEELKEATERIGTAPCDLVELRCDYFTGDPIEELETLRELLPQMPILFTCRTKGEGGECDTDDETYAELNRKAAQSGLADLIDLELNRGEPLLMDLISDIHSNRGRVVCSYHDFSQTPDSDTLLKLFCRMQSLGADITKIAVMPVSEQDVLTVLDAAVQMKNRYADRPYIVLSMGGLGSISRLAGSLTGSAVTFATAGSSSAPGQMDAGLVEQCRKIM